MRYLGSGFPLEQAAGTGPILTSAHSQNGSYYYYQHLYVGKHMVALQRAETLSEMFW